MNVGNTIYSQYEWTHTPHIKGILLTVPISILSNKLFVGTLKADRAKEEDIEFGQR